MVALFLAMIGWGALVVNRLANQTNNPAVVWSSVAKGEYEIGFRADGVAVWRKK
jgi:hypothetical protein